MQYKENKSKLFRPFEKNGLSLKNRVIMAPLTRSRAIDNLANDWIAEYYCQRASAGLIISETISPSPNGLSYPRIPGLFSEEQIHSWKKVTNVIHESNGKIYAQLNHPGRVGSTINLPVGAKLVAPSAIAADIMVYSDIQGPVKASKPESFTSIGIKQAINEFVTAARNALEAGFDGVELHGGNGYLLEQFLNPHVNKRTDQYGGNIENRCRFIVEMTEAVAAEIGRDNLGIRFSPYNTQADMPHYEDIPETYAYLANEMNRIGLLYVHLIDTVTRLEQEGDEVRNAIDACFNVMRNTFNGIMIVNGGYTRERAIQAVESGAADLVSFGIPFISNPDLPYRLEHNLELAAADRATFYSATPQGFTDYSTYVPADQQVPFLPFEKKGLSLKNRIIMAPMTRSRAVDNLPTALVAEYYRQRSSAGLIISESISPSPNGLGLPRIAGIFNKEQTKAWRKVTDEVHKNDGKIFAQLNHTGRVGNSINFPYPAKIVGPSAIALNIDIYSDRKGMIKADTPEPLTLESIKELIGEFVIAARNAMDAGFDGVDLHVAFGYLLEQFLNPAVNDRSDRYGGSIENRCRVIVEITEAVAAEIGADKLGIRFSPYSTYLEMSLYDGINETYAHLSSEMNRIGILYIHVADPIAGLDQDPEEISDVLEECFRIMRNNFSGIMILNGGYTKAKAIQAIASGAADLISFGKSFLANPDLPFRLENDLKLNDFDPATFYTAAQEGFTDYPDYQQTENNF